jgi:hypothetical protein
VRKFNLVIFLLVIFLSNIYASEEKNFTFINITSNITGATITLDGVEIGKTPIYSHKIFTDTNITIVGSTNKKYYPKDVNKTINVQKNKQPTINLYFKKATGKIFFKGENGHLYINKRYITTLAAHNRIIEHPVGDNLNIEISTLNKKFTTTKNLYADKTLEIEYKLEYINTEANLYTITYNELMWQDNDDSKMKQLKYEDAVKYCKDLKLAHFHNWELPSIEQLKALYKIKDKIENGFGANAYWSSEEVIKSNNIWKYSKTLNFENEKVKEKVQSFYDGNVRCVRKIK